ncbi:hypothetical protein H100_00941 [Trichophyton rubrum MR850]|nr:hypothetical protein H100_00941 [Trichophyton rubrum MR850]
MGGLCRIPFGSPEGSQRTNRGVNSLEREQEECIVTIIPPAAQKVLMEKTTGSVCRPYGVKRATKTRGWRSSSSTRNGRHAGPGSHIANKLGYPCAGYEDGTPLTEDMSTILSKIG